MIIGTAGHIDHGKTTLVHALTGVDTDRLPEEKRRGISLDLGYAYIDAARPGERLGFIDVPGHERLLHTMLAGATGIDHALLLIAADDGPMPQTREHLAVLSLLGIPSATIAVTKIDRADPARLQQVRRETAALLAATPFAAAAVFEVSATDGTGIAALRSHLLALAPAAPATDRPVGFRLAVDRAFTLEGLGTVVTGTVLAGEVAVGAELVLVPGERPVRVRSLHAQNRPAGIAQAGQRAALALTGVAKDAVRRGQVLCAPSIALSTCRVDVQLRLWHDEPHPLKSGTPVHLHLGAADVMARVDLLDTDALPPGGTALAQLVSRTPLAAWHGDRLVLRDASARRTLAGGHVLDPLAPIRHRRSLDRLEVLQAARITEPGTRWQALADAAPTGLDLARQAQAEGLTRPPPPEGVQRAGDTAFSARRWTTLRERVLSALDAFHRQSPDELGPTEARLRRIVALPVPPAAWRALLDALHHDGLLQRQGPWLHRPGHAAQLSEQEQRLAEQVLPRLLDGGLDPPWLRELAAALHQPESTLRPALARIARRGEIFPVVRDLYYHGQALQPLARQVRALAARDGAVRAATFRDASGLGRKRAIQVLEFFDRVGLLRRVRDEHVLRPDCRLFEPEGDSPGR